MAAKASENAPAALLPKSALMPCVPTTGFPEGERGLLGLALFGRERGQFFLHGSQPAFKAHAVDDAILWQAGQDGFELADLCTDEGMRCGHCVLLLACCMTLSESMAC